MLQTTTTTLSYLPCLISCAWVLLACNTDIPLEEDGSATADCRYFPEACASTGEDTDSLPTTSAGSFGDETGDASNYCKLNPTPGFNGNLYHCSGTAAFAYEFDYYGDPDGLAELEELDFLFCTEVQDDNDPDLVATCVNQSLEPSYFGFFWDEGNPYPSMEACCIPDTPEGFVADYCTINLAEEECKAAPKHLNAQKTKIDYLPEHYELIDQLDVLTFDLAKASTQEACSSEVAAQLLLLDSGYSFEWQLEDDPDRSWFRNFRYHFTHDSFESAGIVNTEQDCPVADGGVLLAGQVTGGSLKVKSFLGNANVSVNGGAFKVRHEPCSLDICPFEFESFSVDVGHFQIGSLKFSEVNVEMLFPAKGQKDGTKIAFQEGEMHFNVTFTMKMGGNLVVQDAVVGISNIGMAEARLHAGPLFGVQKIDAVNWPFEFRLTTKLASCN